jgi:hypothetical protein
MRGNAGERRADHEADRCDQNNCNPNLLQDFELQRRAAIEKNIASIEFLSFEPMYW